MRLTLRKQDKLHHKNLVDGLFDRGSSIYEYPLRLTWRLLSQDELEGSFRRGLPQGIGSMQLLITVPKKKLRRAVDRVRMRRLIREAYRLNRMALKQKLEDLENLGTLSLAVIYLSDRKNDYPNIEKKVVKLLEKVESAIFTTSDIKTEDNESE